MLPGGLQPQFLKAIPAEVIERDCGCGDPSKHVRPGETVLDLAAELRVKHPLIPSDSIDVVVSNCVLNLVEPGAKPQLFREIFRALKLGGRAVISDIVADEPVPKHLQNDPELWSGCISGALTEEAFLRALEEAGFYGIEILKFDIQPWRTVEGIEFRSMTIQAYKGKQGPCVERNQAVVYRGPFKEVLDDDGHRMERGVRYAVCDKTYNLYKNEPYAGSFDFIDPLHEIPAVEAAPFDCTRSRTDILQINTGKLCNLTILNEPGYEDMADFLARHRVEIVASMPCYSPDNVNEQRGDGVFNSSIQGLKKLNTLGYGADPTLPLHLVYNPNGNFLPPEQTALEADYKRELKAHFGIVFNRLYCITNMPIARFKSWLKHNGKLDDYMEVLRHAFNPAAVAGLMCRNTLSIGWQGEVFDCDFNQQLGMPWRNGEALSVWDLDSDSLEGREIAMADHGFGCTAGCGSSCQGAVAGSTDHQSLT